MRRVREITLILLQPDFLAVAMSTIAIGLLGFVGIFDDGILLIAIAILARRLAFDVA